MLTGTIELPLPETAAPAPEIRPVFLAETRALQRSWASIPLRERLRITKQWRHLIADHAHELATAAGAVSGRPLAEKLVSEVLPLAEAGRWLERNAGRVLRTQKFDRAGRPFWLAGVTSEIQRQPCGVVLIIGPGNYPLFLPGVQAWQALVAGNAVWLKPAPGTRAVMLLLARLAREAGLPPGLLTILPDSIEAAQDAIAEGVDKVIFTGSSENGRAVLATLAETNIPSVVELSGEDAVLVLADADLELVVRALRFGAELNGGETCMAPRRLIVVPEIADALLALLPETDLRVERVRDATAAVARANGSEFALGASIFSRDLEQAKTLAAQLKTGFVLINDLIVPTADPRLPFGGVKASGFGSTRGAEGLLEMTFPHVVAVRSGNSHRHFDEPAPGDAELFSAYLRLVHGRFHFSALRNLISALLNSIRQRKP